ncbi:MAG: hypothetical protein K8J31_29225 [Anaerolineae bacterium]|nr:hypothetical protein [Anaerolineae bacterium]
MLLLSQQKNSKKQGDVGLGIAIAWFTSAGYNVSIPLTDSQDYDLVIGIGNHLSSVQVKTTYYQNKAGNYEANLRVAGGNRSGTGKVKNFDSQSVDFVFVVTESNEKYLIPANEIENKRAIALCEKYSKYLVV